MVGIIRKDNILTNIPESIVIILLSNKLGHREQALSASCLFGLSYVSTTASLGSSPTKGMVMPSHFFPVVSNEMSHATG